MKRVVSFLVIPFLVACALQVAPSGGPKDIEPPLMLDEDPVSGTTSFEEDRIEIEFAEFVQLNRLKDQLVVSPPLKYSLDAQVRGKTLRIGIKDTLKDSTTYVLNFGDAIVDLHENNPIENYTYVLSTGTFIDSGSVGGVVWNAFEANPAEKITLMAYDVQREKLDSLPYLEKPDYLAKTDEMGRFKIEFMKQGKYKIFALKDDNDNYIFDKKTEKIAFIDEIVSSEEKIDTLEFFLFEEDHETQFLKEQEERGPSTNLIFNLDVDTFFYSTELVDSIDLKPLLVDYVLPDDSIRLWWPEMKLRFPLIIEADTLIDTLKVAIDTIELSRRQIRKELSPFKIKSFKPHKYYLSPKLTFNYPVDSINTSLIKLLDGDSVEVPFEIKPTRRATEYIFEYDRVQAQKYVISVDSAAFIDIYGNAIDSLGFQFKLDEEDDYGSLKVNLEIDHPGPFILQLTTPSYDLVKEVSIKEPSYDFQNLRSGTYSLKLILDENGNEEWDTGNYLEGIQPEKVINYQGDMRIRNRWAKEVDWVIRDY